MSNSTECGKRSPIAEIPADRTEDIQRAVSSDQIQMAAGG